ncbi:hypothetical protein [Salimicrobium halophilum]|uniref:Uncharacterized protein n=1 Tax=Salimicrobium halophilum TaxID=86666 RepID=A0A1G8SUK6_9BACI|nr:hypothetical protein [Salimicrobium halophilum]SDJ32260.1 hypothetical protein SAMN04490247_1507 [Salimicrobium halophilum]
MKHYLTIFIIACALTAALFITSDYSGKNQAFHRDKVDTLEEIENQEPATVKQATLEETDDGFFVRLGRESQSSESDMLLPMDAGLLDQSEGEDFIQSIEEQVEEARATDFFS